MDKLHLSYSTKNIPVQGRWEYYKDLVRNIESFSKRMRWKALKCLGEMPASSDRNTYGFKSPRTPQMPVHPEAKFLYAFEKDLLELPSLIKWRHFDTKRCFKNVAVFLNGEYISKV